MTSGMIETFIVSLVGALMASLACAPSWYISYKKMQFYWWEALTPLASCLLWYILYASLNSIGPYLHKSLANIAEVTFFIPLISVVLAYFSTFVLKKKMFNSIKASALYLGIGLLMAVLVFILTPTLRE